MMDYLCIGDRVFGSPIGPGTVTSVGVNGFPAVNGTLCVFVIRDDGSAFDPLRVYAPGGVKGDLPAAVRRLPRTVGGRWRPVPAAAAASALLGGAAPPGAAFGPPSGAAGPVGGAAAGAGLAEGNTTSGEAASTSLGE